MRRFDLTTFLWGLVVTLIGIGLALEATDLWELRVGHLRWAGPALAILVGVVLVVRSMAQSRRDEPV